VKDKKLTSNKGHPVPNDTEYGTLIAEVIGLDVARVRELAAMT
jgi:hypothetical protein